MYDAADWNPVLLDLLVAWDEGAEAGNAAVPEDLCRDYPELVGDLRRYVDRIARIDPLLALEEDETAHAPPLLPGFELLDEVGRGGMGVVYRARDLALDRVVAVKVPHARRGVNIVRRRFEREARTLAQLRHSNIVSIHATGLVGGEPYFVMEYVPGGSLAQLKGQLTATPERTAALLEQVARAVDHAHRVGVIHRDLKPSNILLSADGQPLVSDFGVAALLAGEPLAKADDTPDGRGSNRITRTGAAAGTPAYSAPETFCESPAKLMPAADVWSLGVILYELLTGRLPFPEPAGDELQANITAAAPPKPHAVRKGVPKGLEAVALKCLAKDAGGRFPSAGALADALARWRRRQSVRRQMRRVGLPVVGVLAVLVAALVALWPPGPEARHVTKSRNVQDRLRRGESVTLVGDTGAPLSHRIRLGEGYTRTYMNADGTFAAAAGRPALVELLTDPGVDRFRLSAEIREDGYWTDAYVGVYYAHHIVRTAGDDGHIFGCLRFADRGDPTRQPKGPDGSPLSTVGVDHVCLIAPAITGGDWLSISGPNRPYPVPPTFGAGQGPWRKVAVDVNAAVVQGSFDGLPGGSSFGDFAQEFAMSWAKAVPRLEPRLAGRAVNVSPRGGVGIYVHGCEASIRNCRIDPRPTP